MLDPPPPAPCQDRPGQAAASPIYHRRRPRQPPPTRGPPPQSPALIGSSQRPSRSLAALAAIQGQQGRWCPSRARNHLTRNPGGGGGVTRRVAPQGSPLLSAPARTSVLPNHVHCFSQAARFPRNSGDYLWVFGRIDCPPSTIVLAQTNLLMSAKCWGTKLERTRTLPTLQSFED